MTNNHRRVPLFQPIGDRTTFKIKLRLNIQTIFNVKQISLTGQGWKELDFTDIRKCRCDLYQVARPLRRPFGGSGLSYGPC